MELSSSSLTSGKPIPKKYTADGDDLSPPLEWSERLMNENSPHQ